MLTFLVKLSTHWGWPLRESLSVEAGNHGKERPVDEFHRASLEHTPEAPVAFELDFLATGAEAPLDSCAQSFGEHPTSGDRGRDPQALVEEISLWGTETRFAPEPAIS
jgi:hypothetical protein